MSQSLPQHVADVGRHRNDPPELSAVQRAFAITGFDRFRDGSGKCPAV